jgi:hypothetical protein
MQIDIAVGTAIAVARQSSQDALLPALGANPEGK